MDIKQNHAVVASDIQAPYRICIYISGCSFIINVYKDRKNNVAFGFNILVTKPSKNALQDDNLGELIVSSGATLDIETIDL